MNKSVRIQPHYDHLQLLITLLLVLAVLIAYRQVTDLDFINFDDPSYVTQNPYVKEGLTVKGVGWAFKTFHASNWHPLTWISHMADYELYGLNSLGHHWTNLQFHIANTLLLFFILQQMTGALWKSAFVAALFAIHPLHVESVAWVAERKDVLSTFFGMLTILAYYRYVKHPRIINYLLIILFLSLGLMAKPMLVTLPFVLLLLDFWPLKRFALKPSLQLIREKIPLLIPITVSTILTLMAQQNVALKSLESFPVQTRLANALVSYASYIIKTVWPHKLAAFYPHPYNLPAWQVLGAALSLIGLSFWIIRRSKPYPYLIVGWLWYLSTLIPVIGLIQIGDQAMADRYTYIPLIGIFMIITWGVPELLKNWPYRKMTLALSGIIIVLALTARTYSQVSHWKNSITLFENTIKVTNNNWLAHNNLGSALLQNGKTDEAIFHYKEALKIKPYHVAALKNLGAALFDNGDIVEAISYYKQSLIIDPKDADAHYNLGRLLAKQGKSKEAMEHFGRAIKINPDFAEVYNEAGITLAEQGQLEKARAFFLKAIQIKPNYAEACTNLSILGKMSRQDQQQ